MLDKLIAPNGQWYIYVVRTRTNRDYNVNTVIHGVPEHSTR
jgi:hypothetical protein